MKFTVNPLQPRLFDPFDGLFGDIGLRRLTEGWQGVFRTLLLALMPVKQLGDQPASKLWMPTSFTTMSSSLLISNRAPICAYAHSNATARFFSTTISPPRS